MPFTKSRIVFYTTAIQMTHSCSFHFPQINLQQDLRLSLIISAWMLDHIHDVNAWSQECFLMIYCFFFLNMYPQPPGPEMLPFSTSEKNQSVPYPACRPAAGTSHGDLLH